jgi:spermidine/putrescine ABC transporter ATP-binding subunit
VAAVRIEGVTKRYGHTAAVRSVSLEVASGEFLTLLGPSGCGKTTTLRIVAGLTTPDAGRVLIRGEEVTFLPTFRRNIGMVFQSLALFPHMTVADNVAFGLRMRHRPKTEQGTKMRTALDLVRLGGFEERYPQQLSGGQQQRVAVARALVFDPDVLLLDEPFGALDRKLREEMQVEVRELTRRIGITTLFVTHDQEEALIMSDSIAVMNHGRIEQLGPPAEVFERPRTRFVAEFMGATNFFDLRVAGSSGGALALEGTGLRMAAPAKSVLSAGQQVEVTIRPEKIRIDTDRLPHDNLNTVPAVIETAVYHGTVSTYGVRVPDRTVLLVVREQNREGVSAGPRLPVGARVWASWAPEAVRLLESY